MSYKDYIGARDTSWRILIDCKIKKLPVDLTAICEKMGIRVFSYEAAKEFIKSRKLEEITKSTDGISFFHEGTPIILFDPTSSPGRIRFTIAHELGHIVLEHVEPGFFTIKNRDPETSDDPMETAANQFAVRLLAPACVLWGLNLHTSEEIALACNISQKAAAFRAGRMEELYRRGRFLVSPLEKKVYDQFLPFIKE